MSISRLLETDIYDMSDEKIYHEIKNGDLFEDSGKYYYKYLNDWLINVRDEEFIEKYLNIKKVIDRENNIKGLCQ